MVVRWVAVTLGALFVAAVVAYGVFGANALRWGCASQEELERPRTPREVEKVFARHGLELAQIRWPAALRHARSYQGAIVFRHTQPHAAVTVIVCRDRCELHRAQLRPGLARQRFRGGYSLLTVATWIAADDRASQAAITPSVGESIDDLDPNPDPGSRCYIG